MDLVLCHYQTACETMRAFPNRRRQAWLLVMPGPGPVFVPLSGPDMFLDRTSSYVGRIICPVVCDIVPARHIYPIEASDLNAFRFIPIFDFAPLGHISGRFACLRTVGADQYDGPGAELMAPAFSAGGPLRCPIVSK
jgi:hypothetical protein